MKQELADYLNAETEKLKAKQRKENKKKKNKKPVENLSNQEGFSILADFYAREMK